MNNNNKAPAALKHQQSINNDNNSITQKKHIKLINKKTDESLDSLSYFDETHIQKIRNELNSNMMKQSQPQQLMAVIATPGHLNGGPASSVVKASIVNSGFENENSNNDKTPHER